VCGLFASVGETIVKPETSYTLSSKSLSLGSHSQPFKVDAGGSRRWQKRAAKYIAIMAYLWAVVASVLSILLFLANIVVMELLLAYLPQNESATHIGAWSPWATTVLVIFAAFISKFHETLVRSVFAPVRRAFSTMGHSTGEGHTRGNLQKDEHGTKQQIRKTPKLARTSRGERWSLLGVPHILRFGRDRVLSAGCDVREEWMLLKAFWQDPDNAVDISHKA